MIIRFFLVFIIFTSFLKANESTLELGIGLGSVLYPDYMGSKSYSAVAVPLPYIKYTSENFNIDKDGINQKLFNIKNLTIDLSVSGSLPANSQDNEVRKDMPNLNFTFEVGPIFIFNLVDKKDFFIDLEVAIRGVMETDFKMLNFQGVVASTDLKFEMILENLELTFRSGFRFGNDDYHNYFYGVSKEYETSTRTSYNATAGYSGYKNKIGAIYRDGNWWYGALASYHTLAGASYIDSPLVETKHAFYAGFSFAYIFYTRKQTYF